mgnify:CR=1 FL=1
MKKSVAMCSVIEDRTIPPIHKLEIIERLIDDKRLAEYGEKKEEAENV